jgi:hypothetical protein
VAVFPQGKTRVRERANAGEKRVLDALARHLEDDYAVWHNIPIWVRAESLISSSSIPSGACSFWR